MIKSLSFIFILILYVNATHAALDDLPEIPEDYTLLSEDEVLILQQLDNALERTNAIENLTIAKHYLIAGQTEMARFFLNRVSQENRALNLVKNRYLAVIEIMESDFSRAKEILSQPGLNEFLVYPQICLMKILTMLAGPANTELETEIRRCQNATLTHSSNDQFWLENIGNLKFGRQPELKGAINPDINYLVRNNDIFRIWLKTGLYFNYEKNILSYLDSLPESVLASSRARELIGFLHYRAGQISQAKEFIEGIQSPNTDNMRGNFELQEQKYELAFGHFKLALAKKNNSHNAIERALPLAWLLEQWDDAHDLLNRHILSGLDENAKNALRAALYIRQEKPEYAQQYLTALGRKYEQQMPLELEVMQVYNGLLLGSNELIQRSSERACQRFDGLSCWIQGNLGRWQNLGRAMERADAIYAKTHIDLNQLKLARTVAPLTEERIIDQRDIEELDSLDVVLIQDQL